MVHTHPIVMLPTDKKEVNKGDLFLLDTSHLDGGKQLGIASEFANELREEYKTQNIIIPQHLYILSNDEIKEGDWMYNKMDTSIMKYIKVGIENENPNTYGYQKIIATTDKSLKGYNPGLGNLVDWYDEFPSILESFIKTYIKAYNEGNPITEVQLEWEMINKLSSIRKDNLKLKIREDNTAIIHQAKLYTRENVINIVKLFNSHTLKLQQLKIANSFDVNSWIEENLN